MKYFKTAKGTDIPISDLKGKDYLLVAHRIVWFREDHPDWSIETELLVSNNTEATCKAWIRDSTGRVIATGHKTQTQKGFAYGHSEKAETGAVGRALAFCGYGTQFAPDLEEDDMIVDSPVDKKTSPLLPKKDDTGVNSQSERKSKPLIAAMASSSWEHQQWTHEQMKEYLMAKWGVASFVTLKPEDQKAVMLLTKSKPFRVAMNDITRTDTVNERLP